VDGRRQSTGTVSVPHSKPLPQSAHSMALVNGGRGAQVVGGRTGVVVVGAGFFARVQPGATVDIVTTATAVRTTTQIAGNRGAVMCDPWGRPVGRHTLRGRARRRTTRARARADRPRPRRRRSTPRAPGCVPGCAETTRRRACAPSRGAPRTPPPRG